MSRQAILENPVKIPSIEETADRVKTIIFDIEEAFSGNKNDKENKGGKWINEEITKAFIRAIRSYVIGFEEEWKEAQYKEIADNLESVVKKVKKMGKDKIEQFESAVKNWLSKMSEMYFGKDIAWNPVTKKIRTINSAQYVSMRERMFFVLFSQLGTSEFRRELHLKKTRHDLVEAMKTVHK